jgi:hypothetical protein
VGKYFPSTWQFPVTTNPSFRITGIPLFPAVLAVAVAVAVAYLACHPGRASAVAVAFPSCHPEGMAFTPAYPALIFPQKTNPDFPHENQCQVPICSNSIPINHIPIAKEFCPIRYNRSNKYKKPRLWSGLLYQLHNYFRMTILAITLSG